MELASARLEQRRKTYESVSAWLAALSDDQLAGRLAQAGSGGANVHGNRSGALEVEGAKVFVKQIALTDLERAAKGSTANLFGLPLFYQYGVGSAGFGAWRELEAYLKASAWALSGECPYFPLVYDWRVLPRTVRALSAEQRDRLDRLAAYWDGSPAVRSRLEAIVEASASIVLFLEHAPQTLHGWLKERSKGQPLDGTSETSIIRMHRQLREAAKFMNDRGMLHFDLHGWNVLTDGEQVYAADFGLALSSDYDLSPAERAFFETHRLYDRCYVDRVFVEWLTPEEEPPILTPELSARVKACAPVANVLRRFFQALREDGKTTPYPEAELRAALAVQAGAP